MTTPGDQIRTIAREFATACRRWEAHEATCQICPIVLTTRPRLLHHMCAEGRPLFDGMQSQFEHVHATVNDVADAFDHLDGLSDRFAWNMGDR